jgi:hypothetical protein
VSARHSLSLPPAPSPVRGGRRRDIGLCDGRRRLPWRCAAELLRRPDLASASPCLPSSGMRICLLSPPDFFLSRTWLRAALPVLATADLRTDVATLAGPPCVFLIQQRRVDHGGGAESTASTFDSSCWRSSPMWRPGPTLPVSRGAPW